MGGRVFSRVATAFVALLAALVLQAPARAAESVPLDWSCVAYGSLDARPTTVFSPATRWTCGEREGSLRPERVFLRFDLSAKDAAPDYLSVRRAAFERVHLMVRNADGTVRTRSYTMNQMGIGQVGAFIKARLPAVTPQSRDVVVAFDKPTHRIMFDQAHLVHGDPAEGPHERGLLLMLAALSGMLLMPLAFNLAFFRVLRQQFLLWHCAMTLTLLATILFTSGLSAYFADIGMDTLNALMCLVYGASVATGAMFAWSFIEPGKLHPRLRQALIACAMWSMAISLFHAFLPFVARPVQTDIYYACFLPILAVFFWSVFDAFRRGSRSVKFQIVGWIPLLSVGVLRLVGQLTPLLPPTDAMVLLYCGTVLEVLATTLGVADRFLAIRRQRDMARTEADTLERLSERDPLTGLLNRRAIEPRFDDLIKAGYHTFALLDLDHFKRVNDEFGHAVGDAVLRAVGHAIQRETDTLVVRMGGEEFAMLLRGSEARERAERKRQAIPIHVAREVPELDHIVTASMGLLELPRNGIPGLGFKDYYALADKLLYDAKSGGRNRCITEKMRVFVPRRRERRRTAA